MREVRHIKHDFPFADLSSHCLQRLQNAAYSLANQLHGAGANAKTVSTQSAGAQPMAASTSQTAGAQESAPQWSTDPSVAQSGPAAGTAVGQQGATSAVAQPVAPSAFAPAAATSAADGQAGAATSAAAQPMAASALVPAAVSSAAPVHAAGINTAANPLTARTSASSTNGQVPLSATMISGTSADSVAEGMQRAMANTQRLVNGQTIQAASGMASSQQQAAAPAMAFGSSMAGSQQQAQAADPTMPQATAPAVTSTSGMAATQAQPATPGRYHTPMLSPGRLDALALEDSGDDCGSVLGRKLRNVMFGCSLSQAGCSDHLSAAHGRNNGQQRAAYQRGAPHER